MFCAYPLNFYAILPQPVRGVPVRALESYTAVLGSKIIEVSLFFYSDRMLIVSFSRKS